MLNVPIVTLFGKTLALAFEKALIGLYKKGSR